MPFVGYILLYRHGSWNVPVMEYRVQPDRRLGFNHAIIYKNYVMCISIKINVKYHLVSQLWATFQQYLALAIEQQRKKLIYNASRQVQGMAVLIVQTAFL